MTHLCVLLGKIGVLSSGFYVCFAAQKGGFFAFSEAQSPLAGFFPSFPTSSWWERLECMILIIMLFQKPVVADDDDVWICPECSVAYVDGATDMVCCDGCDNWFHW